LSVFWNAVIPGIVLLGFVIFVHELGHFLAAKWRGVRVLRFSLGFGPRMIGFTRGETEYRLAWIPFGGYVQMAGDSPDPSGTMPGGPEEFLSHPWYGRLAIAAAGPMANLVTAFLVMVAVGMVGVTYPDFPNVVGATPDTSVAWHAGVREGDRIVEVAGHNVESWVPIFLAHSKTPRDQAIEVRIERADGMHTVSLDAEAREPFFSSLRRPSVPPIVGAVVTGMPAYKAGVREGDRVLTINGRPIQSWDELPVALKGTVDRKVRLELERDGRRLALDVVPMDPEGRGIENARIGIEAPRQGAFVQRFGPLESLEIGVRGTVALVGSVYGGMWLTLSRPLYYREYVGGPLFIAQAASDQARRGLDSYLQFLAMINVAIMAFNLLPLPVLDGGHILLALLEAVRRQAISARSYLRFQQVGLVVMGALLVLILANDPLRVVQRQRALGRTNSTSTTAPPSPSAPEETPVVPTPP
jgi:regulator of sigma E protease